MTDLTALTHIIFASITLIIPCKFYCDWQDFIEYRREKTSAKLLVLQNTANKWIRRHFSCALLATVICVVITQQPVLRESGRLSELTAAYAFVCFICAIAESILAQKIAAAVQQ